MDMIIATAVYSLDIDKIFLFRSQNNLITLLSPHHGIGTSMDSLGNV